MLWFLLLTSFLWYTVESQFNLYDTYQAANINRLQFDCLKTYRYTSAASFSAFEYVISYTAEYCLRSNNVTYSSVGSPFNSRDQNLTFKELRYLNVTAEELIFWSAPIDLVEEYQDYLNRPINSLSSNEIFFNCTKPWFGSHCQYSFGFGGRTMLNLDDVLLATARYTEMSSYEDGLQVTNLTCYIHLECDRGGPSICLDWREVCDGKIDCLDGGIDEAHCFDFEVNECRENEFRCYNGLCIANEFWQTEYHSFICTSQPLPSMLEEQTDSCLINRVSHCDERSCPPGSRSFTCGDGQCVEDFRACRNGRHDILTRSMIRQGDLVHDCWLAMICFTKITDQIDEVSCEKFFATANLIAHIQSCESLIQFPIIPVLFGHVRFLYNTTIAREWDRKLALPPDYVCYDEQLCDFLIPTFRNGSYACRHAHEIGLGKREKYPNWFSIIHTIKPYFRGCLTRYKNESSLLHSSLYCCKNSSKCISKHRIVDGVSDCHLNDDEEQFELSCSINDTYRFRCQNEDYCRSPLLSRDICTLGIQRHIENIQFREVCDHTVHLQNDDQNHTDETECEHWPCSTIYTQCNIFRGYPDEKDHGNGTASICNVLPSQCITPHNHVVMCSPRDITGNEIVNCLGVIDESDICRTSDLRSRSQDRFRCWNTTKCLSLSAVCNGHRDCLFGDDEVFCTNRHGICEENQLAYRRSVEHALCRIGQTKGVRAPVLTRDITTVNTRYETNDFAWVWRCNRGLFARFSLASSAEGYVCFCPPNYYGDSCQYQNQRVFLQVTPVLIDQHGIYAIIVSLIDDDDGQEVHSYEQFVSVGQQYCAELIEIYLLYSKRPKNDSQAYSVRIDAFEKVSLAYIASWHYNIPFLFLPVNRMAFILTVPSHQAPKPNNCPLTCIHGECLEYTNKERFFCRCEKDWSGVQCQIPINCGNCSSNSLCVGQIDNRSICVCPLNTYGSRCLLPRACPLRACENKGRCVSIYPSFNNLGYACICPEQFGGLQCQHPKTKLEIHLNNLEIPPYVFVHIIIGNEYQSLSQKMMFQKLRMFQHTITLYILEDFYSVFLKISGNYYLAVLQEFNRPYLSTSIDSTQRCRSINELLNSTMMTWSHIRQMKFYHKLCQTQFDFVCFFDNFYMCLCTVKRTADCYPFNHNPDLTCREKTHCQNGAECFQDSQICPLNTLCICTDCYFGDQCQFYAKGIGLTLDDILRYQIRWNSTFTNQPLLVKMSAALTMMMFVAGLINSVLSFITFQNGHARKVGCGMYLLASSITSLFTVSMLTVKFWFLIFTQMNGSVSRSIHRGGCVSIEPLLKLMLYTDNWLDACVAVERAITIYKGVTFNKFKSKRVALWTILFLPLFTMGTIIHEPLYRDLFDDKEERRTWCVTNYSHSIQNYNTIILLFHFLLPFSCNIFSALFIIFNAARHRARIRTEQSYGQHLRNQLSEHKQLLISPFVLVVLSLPRLIISLLPGCVKASGDPWLYLFGYFISFIPSVVVFAVFVLPSDLYKKQFQQSFNNWRRWLH